MEERGGSWEESYETKIQESERNKKVGMGEDCDARGRYTRE